MPIANSESEPLVSVVLPVYNGERFLLHTIESVRRQTYRNLEIIVVDDGSTDRSNAVVQSLAAADPRIRLVSQPNSGVARARNRGLAEAHGEFVAPLDADDLWDPAKIERQVQRMRECGDETGFVYCWWVWIDEKGSVLDRSPDWEIEGNAHELLLRVNYTGNASVPLYRRRCLEAVGGYDESLEDRGGRGCEDWDVALKVASRFPVALVRQLLVGYRRLPDSMSTQCDAMWRSQQLLTAAAVERQPEMDPALLRWSSDQFALYIAGVMFRCGNYFHSFRWALRAWRTGLLFRVLPYALRALAHRVVPWRAVRQTMVPGAGLDTARISRPLIPYDRIYAAGKGDPGWPSGQALIHSRMYQTVILLVAFLFIWSLHRENDGLWFQGDAPRHAANGLFWYDLASAKTMEWRDFALRYYARYPVINPVTYPPLFYVMEGLVFRVFGPSTQAAKVLILVFGMLTGWYTMLWGRRWLGPAAGWAGPLLAFVPGIVMWTNTVMLNVPAVALGLACLYHGRRWIESGSAKQFAAWSLLAVATLLTYYQGGIVILIGLAWIPILQWAGWTRRRRGVAILAAACAAVLPVLIAAVFAPVFLTRNLPSLTSLAKQETWTFYPSQMPVFLGPLLLALGLAGLAAGMLTARWRKEGQVLAVWILTNVVVFSALPAKDSRYILIVAPAFLLAAAMGFTALADVIPVLSSRFGAVVLAMVLITGAWMGSLVRIPVKSGFRAVASYVSSYAPDDAVLYDGYHDGLFGFYFRALDPDYRRRLVLGQQVLYHYGPGASFDWVETDKAASTEEVVNLLQTESGCKWIAIEVGPYSEWATGQRLLRKAVAGPQFELVRTFPVVAPNAERIDLYRQLGPVRPVSRVNVQMKSFAKGGFKNVPPITR